jgi:hypothetical protein
VITEQIRKFRIEPIAIANLNRQLVSRWQFLEEWNEPVQKLTPIPTNGAIEERKLHDDRPRLLSQNVHRVEKFSVPHRSQAELFHA